MNKLATKLHQIKQRIAIAAQRYQRDPASTQIVGASKMQSTETVKQIYQAGLSAIGENYLQEAISKQQQLSDCQLQWHFIGNIQSNKTRDIADHFDWVQSVDRLKIAKRLNHHRRDPKPLQLLIQLNIDDEQSKQGVSTEQAQVLCLQISELENLQLRGFMLIPKAREDFEQQRRPFAQARALLEQLNQKHGLQMDTLSMGMSGDLEAAVAEGSTMVRIGTDLFGARSLPSLTDHRVK